MSVSESVNIVTLSGLGSIEWVSRIEDGRPAWYEAEDLEYTIEWVITVGDAESMELLQTGLDSLIRRVGGEGVSAVRLRPTSIRVMGLRETEIEQAGSYRCSSGEVLWAVSAALYRMKEAIENAGTRRV